MHAEWGDEFKAAAGYCPEWYPLLSAARYLGVPPWELAEQPVEWMEWALAAQSAEAAAHPQPGRQPPRGGMTPRTLG